MGQLKKNWKAVWDRKSADHQSDDLLKSLIQANGFDTGCGDYSSKQWNVMTRELVNMLEIDDSSRVLEVGCGAGALLFGIQSHSKAEIFGYDYSASLISSAKNLLSGDFKVSEALVNPFADTQFNFVISHSVFQYFPTQDYAFDTISVMANALLPGGKIALLDLNDASCAATYHDERKKNCNNPEEYEERYRDLPHLFFSKEKIGSHLSKLGFENVSFPKHAIPDYANSKYRFNVIGTKKH